jgi:hypothetical protein
MLETLIANGAEPATKLQLIIVFITLWFTIITNKYK